ncbi:MAG TPA: alpha/beta hydrolase-fold protein [Ktedonobacteraceae bacterium]|nr:alpha/beta hydrolase-fold protein [Ktedonobacteraceae bacterium]
MKREIKMFLVATAIVTCIIMVLLSGFWGDLGNFATYLPLPGLVKLIPTRSPEPLPSPAPVSTPKQSYRGFGAYTFTNQGNSLTYYLSLPAHYNPTQKYPLVLLLHGGGERSKPQNTLAQNEQLLLNDPYAQVWSADYNGPGNPHIQQRWPCFVVIPQMELSQQWVNVNVHQGSYTQPAQPSIPLQLTKELLDTLQRDYRSIDARRLYITGLSNGGFGTWDAIERWPGYFAAAAPIAGAGDPSKAAVLKNLPIWAFHGSADTVIPASGSRQMIAAIQAAGGHPRYTEFAGQGHGVWTYVYSLDNSALNVTAFFPWLFSQHK